ncbi:hypothetical protein, partial [Bradyrhizobium sp.]|uniref:hypothetical protein n=1 Tax=Bradyrhizobium sp. TaxID=376 RepID=UPI003918A460
MASDLKQASQVIQQLRQRALARCGCRSEIGRSADPTGGAGEPDPDGAGNVDAADRAVGEAKPDALPFGARRCFKTAALT